MYLNKPLNGNASSVSVNDLQPPPTPHTPLTPLPGIRAHLGHLLPRHTYFRARVTIHQISSVPFVSGEFGVRWKFKGVQSVTTHKSGLLVRVKARAAEKRTGQDKGKAREDVAGQMGSDSPLPLSSPLPLTPIAMEDGQVIVVDGRQKVGGGRSASGSASGSGRTEGSSSQKSSVSSHSSLVGHSQHLSADWGTNTSSPPNIASPSTSKNSSSITIAPTSSTSTTISDLSTVLNSNSNANSPIVSSTPARGMTPFIKLKDHSVIWSQTLDTVIKLDVDRESSLLHPNPLKLVVMQRVIPDDPHSSPMNPRLGAVYLNLSEYVGQGVVDRRYLLKESKTNATLKLSIEMTYASGEINYIPPPLAKGEILTGLAGFLENDTVKKRPRALDIYGPYQDQEDGAKSTAIPRTAKSLRRPSDKSTLALALADRDRESDSEEDRGVDREGDGEEGQGVDVAFDVQRLPFAYGTKTTELLIDALFNPVVISEKKDESPFTVYVPPSESPSPEKKNGQRQREVGIGLGLSGIVMDRGATLTTTTTTTRRQAGGGGLVHPRRQQSTSSSVYTTTSTTSSTGSKAETSESSSVFSRGPAQAQGHQTHRTQSSQDDVVVVVGPVPVPVPVVKSAPEGRVVVGPAQEEQIGGVRAWWRKRTMRAHPPQPLTPTAKI